ncbi:hypothetical protein GQ53DRAFT_738616 [Thozetella sp. PMI_491]|nr:hypothetical protein GQ53DRAFT_738616 [Thozetella sp. PMI_491]
MGAPDHTPASSWSWKNSGEDVSNLQQHCSRIDLPTRQHTLGCAASTPRRSSGRRCSGNRRSLTFVEINPSRLSNKGRSAGPRHTHSSPPSPASDRLCQGALEQKYVGLFWDNYLPADGTFAPNAAQYTVLGWTRVAQNLAGKGEVARLALAGNSLCMLGVRHREEWMFQQGKQVYGRALAGMRKALQNSTRHQLEDLLVASRLLTLFMLLFGNDCSDSIAQRQAWASLNAGEMALFLSRSPEAYRSGSSHQLLVDARLHLLMPSIVQRTRSALNSDLWKTIPWSIIPKSPLDKLVDLVAEIPDLLQELDSQNHMASGNTPLPHLVARCSYFAARLRSWHAKMLPDLLANPVLCVNNSASSTVDLGKAHVLALYWSFWVLLFPALSSVLPAAELSLGYGLHSARQNALKYAALLFTAGAGWFGTNIAVLPLRLAFISFDTEHPSPREKTLLKSIFKTRQGREISNFLFNFRRSPSGPGGGLHPENDLEDLFPYRSTDRPL